ncbi:MAG TPA: hypothetical protein VHB21_19965, partial [Minicystis sp.]|nr:hypothetical protein [Minicystis sp.]
GSTDDDTVALVVARKPRANAAFVADGWEVDATAIAPSHDDALAVRTQWSYGKGSTAGLVVTVTDARRRRAWATFEPFGDAAASSPAPTAFDLPDRPRPCSAAERAATPRVDLRAVPDATERNERAALADGRRLVIVGETVAKGFTGVTPILSLVGVDVVAHGTPASPCAAAHVARSLTGAPQATAILSGDLKHAWLFRAADRPAAPRRLGTSWPSMEYRPMSCRYEPGVKLSDAGPLLPTRSP